MVNTIMSEYLALDAVYALDIIIHFKMSVGDGTDLDNDYHYLFMNK